ncbi:MAG: exodeoxyribonuclease V subunit gamma [Actinomycetota bacterium]|nr:exodeoxyribonuclease V subunit gamma [Actinomycetota bacterium]
MLHIHRAERADGLVDALSALLADPPADPFAPEVIAVPTRGMERWLTQRMSARLDASEGRADGVCANIAFPSPRRLVGDAVAAASGIAPDADPWLPERALRCGRNPHTYRRECEPTTARPIDRALERHS